MTVETAFKNIADAIRERGGTSGPLTPAEMPQAILDIQGGGEMTTTLLGTLNAVGNLQAVYTDYDFISIEIYNTENPERVYVATFPTSVINTTDYYPINSNWRGSTAYISTMFLFAADYIRLNEIQANAWSFQKTMIYGISMS